MNDHWPLDASVNSLAFRFTSVRARTESLAERLSPEDQVIQSMPDASPTKWHRAHTTWFFETFLLRPCLPGYVPFDERFAYLFNSYYETAGPRHARPMRGMVTRPGAAEVGDYRAHVDMAMAQLLHDAPAEAIELVELGLQHEQQHQELLVTDALHALAQNPVKPAWDPQWQEPPDVTGAMTWLDGPAGLVEIGNGDVGFAFDNERPRHRSWLEPYRIADRLVTNGAWLEFMQDGGYRTPTLWMSEGWGACSAEGWDAPMHWQEQDGAWWQFTPAGLHPVDFARPVRHVSWYEADAFARWAGKRLPTEQEYEASARLPGFHDVNRHRLAMDRQCVSPLSRFPAMGGSHRGVQREVHGGPDGAARRFARHATGPCPPDLQKLLSSRQALAIHRRASGGGRMNHTSAPQPLLRDTATEDEGAALLDDALRGLSAARKTLPCKWLYDEEGARLFGEITLLPEYYPTRTELGILREHAGDIGEAAGPGAVLVEFGSGDGEKAALLLEGMPRAAAYVPVDIAPAWLDEAGQKVAAAHPSIAVLPVVADFSAPFDLPREIGAGRRVGFFPGSTIGNFTPEEAKAFLRRARATLGDGALFVLGADLVKDEAVLVAAYDDAAGVTARFNTNLLRRLNRECGADFDLDSFRHQAVWNADLSRMEMHLVSLRDQVVTLADQRIDFRTGETIHTENSHKYRMERLAGLLSESGWVRCNTWTDPQRLFSVWMLAAGDS